ncbi:MAG: hypothetical protein AB1390_10360 [Nitrospirota bacterium]
MENVRKSLLKISCIFAMTVLLLGAFANIIQAQSASVELKKYTNGLDFSIIPEIPVGSEVAWQYIVTNTGDTDLTNIIVTDDQGISVKCPSTSLKAGDSMICEGEGIATEGQYENIGIVEAVDPGGNRVTDEDAGYYFGVNVDSDGDGIYDDADQCLGSNTNTTLVIADCETGVENVLFDDGCTMSDLIAQCADSAKNHGKFVKCVAHLTNQWKKAQLISGKEKGAIQSCAARSDIP